MSNNSTINSIGIERGKRVKFLRSYIAAMTGEIFAKHCSVTRGTVTNWERGKGKTGLTDKGGYQVVQAMQNIGIHCALDWLLHGVGDTPKIIDQHKLSRIHYPMLDSGRSSKNLEEPKSDVQENFLEEVALFKQKHPMHLLYDFQDNSMSPIYVPGDCVGGPRLGLHELTLLQHGIFIVLLQPDQILVRRVQFGQSEPKSVSLYVVNPEASLEHPPMSCISLDSIIAIAPITRLWRTY